ncbi:MAG: PD40 domain-containing protein [Caldilineaceae bacterium]|nr:PD40 domain-containing protein [Caldilineaceae bacterium]
MKVFWKSMSRVVSLIAIGLLLMALFAMRSRWQGAFFPPQTAAPAAQTTPEKPLSSIPAAQIEQVNQSPLPTPANPGRPVWTAQNLRVVSDEPFEIRAFVFRDTDEVDDPKWSPDGQAIIVNRTTGFEKINDSLLLPLRELWVLQLDGTGELLGENISAAEWSPTGEQIAYLRRQPTTEDYSLWVQNRSNGRTRQIVEHTLQRRPLWLTNNSMLIVSEDGSVNAINNESLQRTLMTPIQAYVHQFQGTSLAVSPDGHWLATRSTDNPEKLTMFATQGQSSPWIIPEGDWDTYSVIIGSIAWSPDGTKLAFTGYNGKVGDTIYIINIPNRLEQYLSLHIANTAVSSIPRSLSWSPDGNVLLFAARNESTRTTNLYVVNSDGSNLRNISQDINISVRTPAWSPDGKYIFYASERNINRKQQLRIMTVTSR